MHLMVFLTDLMFRHTSECIKKVEIVTEMKRKPVI